MISFTDVNFVPVAFSYDLSAFKRVLQTLLGVSTPLTPDLLTHAYEQLQLARPNDPAIACLVAERHLNMPLGPAADTAVNRLQALSETINAYWNLTKTMGCTDVWSAFLNLVLAESAAAESKAVVSDTYQYL